MSGLPEKDGSIWLAGTTVQHECKVCGQHSESDYPVVRYVPPDELHPKFLVFLRGEAGELGEVLLPAHEDHWMVWSECKICGENELNFWGDEILEPWGPWIPGGPIWTKEFPKHFSVNGVWYPYWLDDGDDKGDAIEGV